MPTLPEHQRNRCLMKASRLSGQIPVDSRIGR